MARRFEVSETVWKEYINFCIKSKSYLHLDTVLSKFIQLHNDKVENWIIVATVQMKVLQNFA